MAQFKLPVVVNGIEFTRDLVQKFMNDIEFGDSVPEEYKKGFYDFGNALVKTLDKIQKECEENEIN